MRPFPFVLSVAAGVVFFYLVAKLLFFGLIIIAPLALAAGLVLAIRRRLGYGYPHWRSHYRHQHWRKGLASPMGYSQPPAEPLADYRTIIVE